MPAPYRDRKDRKYIGDIRASPPQHLPHRVLADAELLGCSLDRPDRLVRLTYPLTEDLVLEVGAQHQASPLQVDGHRLVVETELLCNFLDRTAAAMQLDHLIDDLWPQAAVDAPRL